VLDFFTIGFFFFLRLMTGEMTDKSPVQYWFIQTQADQVLQKVLFNN